MRAAEKIARAVWGASCVEPSLAVSWDDMKQRCPDVANSMIAAAEAALREVIEERANKLEHLARQADEDCHDACRDRYLNGARALRSLLEPAGGEG